MDQPAYAEKACLTGHPGLDEVIELSRAFLRPDIVPGIDSVRRHLLHASWTGPTAFRYVTPDGHTHDHGSILGQLGSTGRPQSHLACRETAQSTPNERA